MPQLPIQIANNTEFQIQFNNLTKYLNFRDGQNYVVYLNKLRKLCVLPLSEPYEYLVGQPNVIVGKFEEEAFVVCCVFQGIVFDSKGYASMNASFTPKEIHFIHNSYYVDSFLQDADFRNSQSYFVLAL